MSRGKEGRQDAGTGADIRGSRATQRLHPEMAGLPPKAELDAATDRQIAFMRESREAFTGAGPDADFYLTTSASAAAQLREQFPDIADLGRIVTAVAYSFKAMTDALAEKGLEDLGGDSDVLVAIHAFAGEQLDREALPS
jgi:hypothetical protein